MALVAGGVGLADPLKDPLAQIGQKRQGSLQEALARLQARNAKGQAISGRPQGQYTGEEFGRASTMASRGIDDALLGVLGGASYKDQLNQQEHDRQMALARELGDLNSPSVLQEVLGGLGIAGQSIPAFMTIGKSFKRKPKAPTPNIGFGADDAGPNPGMF